MRIRVKTNLFWQSILNEFYEFLNLFFSQPFLICRLDNLKRFESLIKTWTILVACIAFIPVIFQRQF
jgi:hypothetical protein